MATLRDSLLRWAWMLASCCWLAASGCLCYGGGEPPPEDDDDSEDDDDVTNNSDVPDYDVEGFNLDIGMDTGDGQYEGIVVEENGSVSSWSGYDGSHEEEQWLATLTESQLDELVHAIDPDTFFTSSIEEGGDPECVLEFRLGMDVNEAIHPAGAVPDELEDLYRQLDDILDIFGIEHGCA